MKFIGDCIEMPVLGYWTLCKLKEKNDCDGTQDLLILMMSETHFICIYLRESIEHILSHF